jgi:HNH endonuclease
MKSSHKSFVRQRAKNCCEYCLAQERYSADAFSIEHIIPVSKDGDDDLENLALSCQRCNNYKFNLLTVLDPATGNLVSFYNPRLDSWHTHFRWNESFTEIDGISPEGRATVLKLRLNREGLVNLRSVLTQLGLHPPL